MLALALATFGATVNPLRFMPTPSPAELCRGQQICARGKGPERTLEESRMALASSFDGAAMRDTEEIVWLNPASVSRWLGGMQQSEGWSQDELTRRWLGASEMLQGRLTFMIRLSALPGISALEPDDEVGPTPMQDLDSVRAFLEFDSSAEPTFVPLELRQVEERQTQDRGEALNLPWYHWMPSLAPTGDSEPCAPGYPLGSYYGRLYIATVAVPEKMPHRFTVRVSSKGRRRKATFCLPDIYRTLPAPSR
ncbi:MAG: hypothetical protein JSS72_12020 [Armatimonadetes bacterium]|nr:hypothetical protein [Armatimonadota bacterium]